MSVKNLSDRYNAIKSEKERVSSYLTETKTRKSVLESQRDGYLRDLAKMGLNSLEEAKEYIRQTQAEIEDLVQKAESALMEASSFSSNTGEVEDEFSFPV